MSILNIRSCLQGADRTKKLTKTHLADNKIEFKEKNNIL